MQNKEEISNRQQNHEINRTKLTPESYGHGRTPRTTSYERTCQARKDQTSADQATEHIE
jgi:hypothetical protein